MLHFGNLLKHAVELKSFLCWPRATLYPLQSMQTRSGTQPATERVPSHAFAWRERFLFLSFLPFILK